MNALFVISICECINIFTLLVLLRHYFNITYVFLHSKNEIILFASIFGVISYIVNYFILYRNKGKITKKYNNDNKLTSVLGFIGLLVYILGSFYFAYLVGSSFPIR